MRQAGGRGMPDADPLSDNMFEMSAKDLNAVEVGTWSPRFA